MIVIEKDKAIEAIGDIHPLDYNARSTKARIEKLPTIEIVRCMECKRRDICRTTNIWAVPPNDNWFCADGERRSKE